MQRCHASHTGLIHMTLRKWPMTNSSLTVLKILGALAMLLDHYNSFLKADYSPLLYEMGRLAWPLFAFVLGYNLARIPTRQLPHLMLRLLIFGILSTPLYNMLSGGLDHWWPLNILFTLLAATTTVYLLSVPVPKHWNITVRLAGVLLFIASGSLIDYFWIGSALVVVIWRLFTAVQAKERTLLNITLAVLVVLLCLLNDSLAALLAVPVIALCRQTCQTIALPRMKWFFYWFYPGHLLALLVLSS